MVEVTVENFINGEFISSVTFLPSFDPATGEVWASIPDSNASDVESAVAAAKEAFKRWSKTPVSQRSKLLNRIADVLETRLDKFALAESRDHGKPVTLAKAVDIPRAVYNFRFFASSILHTDNRSTLQDEFKVLNYTTNTPVGVAGVISPWNLPLYLLTWKIAPCIAYGNTCVCKPSEFTSVTAWMLCQVLKEAGLPSGVVNMVFGLGPKVGEAICSHPDVPLITFTGSTATGQRIQQTASRYCKKLSLELGGKNPGIVFADADLQKCIPTMVRACFSNQGEICLCNERLYVQDTIFDQFVKLFVEATRKLKIGDPLDPTTTMGALVSKEHFDKVRSYLDLAIKEGGSVECGYSVDPLEENLPQRNKNGYFILPTILTGLPDDSRVNQEEIFGPVVTISSFKTEQEAIDRANNTKYGLSANVWSRDIGIVHRVAQGIEAGTVWCNCWMVRDLRLPFGGMKMSGLGRESQHDSLEFFTEQKTICIQHD